MRFAILLLLAAVASADQLTPYGKRTFHSVDGEWRLVTKESTGKFSFVLKNKAGVVRGKGEIDHLPVHAAVFHDGGGFVLWGRYLREGRGVGVARYDYDGTRRWSYEYKQLFDDAERAAFPRTLSFIFWADKIWIDKRHGEAIGSTMNKSIRIFDLQTGKVRPGGKTVLLRSLEPASPPLAAIDVAGAWFKDEVNKRMRELAADEKLELAKRVAAASFLKQDATHAQLFLDALDDKRAAPRAVRAAAHVLPRDEARDLLVRAATDKRLAQAAVNELARMGDVAGLVEVVSHGDVPAAAKKVAAVVLGALPYEQIEKPLLKEFGDADLDTAVVILDALILAGDKELPRRLQPHQQKLIALIGRNGANVEWLADCFTRYPTTEAVRPLLKAARTNPKARKSIFKALRACTGLRIGDDLAKWERALR
ncbi:MAG: hypothetical protein ACYTHK_07355 [Planctomycetota bacterium]|jgi:hypothetical protein